MQSAREIVLSEEQERAQERETLQRIRGKVRQTRVHIMAGLRSFPGVFAPCNIEDNGFEYRLESLSVLRSQRIIFNIYKKISILNTKEHSERGLFFYIRIIYPTGMNENKSRWIYLRLNIVNFKVLESKTISRSSTNNKTDRGRTSSTDQYHIGLSLVDGLVSQYLYWVLKMCLEQASHRPIISTFIYNPCIY